MKALAHTYQKAFPKIFTKSYEKKNFNFVTSTNTRTQASFKAFVGTIFGEDAVDKVEFTENDEILTVIRNCQIIFLNTRILNSFFCTLQAYQQHPDYKANWIAMTKNETFDSEMKKFERAPVYTKLVADISRLLGFNRTLTAKEVDAVYEMCSFDQSCNLRVPSVWCSVCADNILFA